MSDKSDSAFPSKRKPNASEVQSGQYQIDGKVHTPGLTKREWFAGMILSGLMANPENDLRKLKAVDIFRNADAMIEEAKK